MVTLLTHTEDPADNCTEQLPTILILHLAQEPRYNSNLHILARAALHTATDVSGVV